MIMAAVPSTPILVVYVPELCFCCECELWSSRLDQGNRSYVHDHANLWKFKGGRTDRSESGNQVSSGDCVAKGPADGRWTSDVDHLPKVRSWYAWNGMKLPRGNTVLALMCTFPSYLGVGLSHFSPWASCRGIHQDGGKIGQRHGGELGSHTLPSEGSKCACLSLSMPPSLSRSHQLRLYTSYKHLHIPGIPLLQT